MANLLLAISFFMFILPTASSLDICLAQLFLHLYSFGSGVSGRNSRISPVWQSSARQMASSVEKRIARTLPVLSFERLTTDISMRSDSSCNDILRRASITSKLVIIIALHFYRVAFSSSFNIRAMFISSATTNITNGITIESVFST